MASAGDSGQVVAELVTAGLVTVGLMLFFFACAIAWTKGSWRKTHAVVFAAEGQTSLRWHDTRYEFCEAKLSAHQAESMQAGSDVIIHYQMRGPENWSFESPHRRTRMVAAAGVLMAIVGTAASLVDAVDAFS